MRRFSRVAQRTGVYTVHDYAEIIETLVNEWKIDRLSGLSDLSAKAQEYLCSLASRYRSLSERITLGGPDRFSRLFGRQAG